MTDDASPTYRGFKSQARYVLHRLLTDPNAAQQVYRPEGAEDLAIYDSQLRLIEAVQVKDYASDLALSHLKPASDAGFFERFRVRRRDHPNCITKIASFGAIGPELGGAIAGESKHRASVVKKLLASNQMVSENQANEM